MLPGPSRELVLYNKYQIYLCVYIYTATFEGYKSDSRYNEKKATQNS